MKKSVSQHLTRFLRQNRVNTVFGVPGAYHVNFLDTVSRDNALQYVQLVLENAAR